MGEIQILVAAFGVIPDNFLPIPVSVAIQNTLTQLGHVQVIMESNCVDF